MKTQINQLVKLAEEIRDFGKEIKLPNDNHTTLSGDYSALFFKNGAYIKVYFADNRKTSAIYLGLNTNDLFEVMFFSNTINMSMNFNAEKLKEIHKSCKGRFEEIKNENTEVFIETEKKKKRIKIDLLKKQIEDLEKEC